MDLEYHFADEETRKTMPKPIYKDGWKMEWFFTEAFEGRFSIDIEAGLIRNNFTGKIYTHPNNKGYIDIGFNVLGTSQHVLAHRVIWWAAIGPIPDHLMINHINGIKTDNRLCNLEVVTNQENVLHAFRTGLIDASKIGSRMREYYDSNINACTKLSFDQVCQILHSYYRLKIGPRELGRQFDIPHTCILKIVKGKSYRAWTREIAARLDYPIPFTD